MDSKTSSKPPSTDLLNKPEKAKEQQAFAEAETKRKPAGQPGHEGRTSKGFGRVDRYQLLKPQSCPHCGSETFIEQLVAVQRQQVARLVERPIEIVEYQRLTCECVQCSQSVSAAWPKDIIPGQDLSAGLQALLVWLGNYGHLSYEKQQELLWELWQPIAIQWRYEWVWVKGFVHPASGETYWWLMPRVNIKVFNSRPGRLCSTFWLGQEQTYCLES